MNSCLQACVRRGTPTETGTSLRTPASSTSPRQRAAPRQPNLGGRAPPGLLSEALLPPPSSSHPLSPAPCTPPTSARHLTPALPRPPPSARLRRPVCRLLRLRAPPRSPALPRLRGPASALRLPEARRFPSAAPLFQRGACPLSRMSLSRLTRPTVVLTRSSPPPQPGDLQVTSLSGSPRCSCLSFKL